MANIIEKYALMLPILLGVLIVTSVKTEAADLKQLRKRATQSETASVPKMQTSNVLSSPLGLKEVKQAADSGLTQTPFNRFVTSDTIELHVEALKAANSNSSTNYEELGRPIPNKGTPRTEITCKSPQLLDSGKCVDPPTNYEALGKPIRNKAEPGTKAEITCNAPQVSDGMGKCITPLTGPPLDCPEPAFVINNQCVMQPK